MERVVLSVDVACFALDDARLNVLLVQRVDAPFAHTWALPGGAVDADEPLDAAAARILVERTGVWGTYLEQLYTFGDPGRDPRGRTVSVAYYALLSPGGSQPLRVGRPLAFYVLPAEFTLGDLRTLSEAVDGRRYDPSNFQKQMLARWDLAPVPGARDRRTRRPARLYRYIGPRHIDGPPSTTSNPPAEEP